VVARLPAAREGPGSNRAGDKSLFSRKSLRYAALGTGCTLTAVPRSTQLSTLRGTVNEYQPYGWVIIPMAMGECSASSSLQVDSKVKFAAWPTSASRIYTAFVLPLDHCHLAQTYFGPEEPWWTLAYGWRRRWQHYKYRRGYYYYYYY